MKNYYDAWNGIKEEIDARREEYAHARMCETVAKIFRLIFICTTMFFIAALDSEDWISMVLMMFLNASLAFTAHIFVMAYHEEAEELKGFDAWER